jgi:hypothetical protein
MDASVESCRNVCSWWWVRWDLSCFCKWINKWFVILTSWEHCWYRIARWCSCLSATLVGGRSSPRLNFRSYTSPNLDKSGTPYWFHSVQVLENTHNATFCNQI